MHTHSQFYQRSQLPPWQPCQLLEGGTQGRIWPGSQVITLEAPDGSGLVKAHRFLPVSIYDFFLMSHVFVDRSIFGHLQVLAIPVFIFGYDLFSFFSGHVAMVPRLLCVKVFSNK